MVAEQAIAEMNKRHHAVQEQNAFGAKINGRTRLLVMAALNGLLLCGCSGATADVPNEGARVRNWTPASPTRATRPTVADTGGTDTNWYWQYVFAGGTQDATIQVLVVTTNSRFDLRKVPPLTQEVSLNVPVWREVYCVPASVSATIERSLNAHNFFDWPSFLLGGADMYTWEISARTPASSHRVILDEFLVCDDETSSLPALDEFVRPQPHEFFENDLPPMALSKELFNLVEEVRRLARSGGKLLISEQAQRHEAKTGGPSSQLQQNSVLMP